MATDTDRDTDTGRDTDRDTDTAIIIITTIIGSTHHGRKIEEELQY
eukprot:CAMPEP_0204629790 /NCGR_PEP_ID=MMETSP0717-20131115/18916_1 /ASSEMBLY_ACC=CAM_ASM_000666 /TAXON_ID=230516 /ORGANISM="Chaetoceros curvisetus" /LENGTH=45 /DNA_ID= /DNA_START= /DNA_END= /DNA_ORIENTATION=